MSEHATRPGRYFLIAFILIFAVLMADQYSKWYVLEHMVREKSTEPFFGPWFLTRQPIQVFLDQIEEYKTVTFASFLDFKMVWNRGISFGLFDTESPKMPVLFMALSLCVCAALFTWMVIARGRLLLFALPLIIGGALGNVCDRVRFGAVADFIDVHVGEHHWPAFNVADSCICVGTALLIIHALLGESAKEEKPAVEVHNETQ